MATRLYWHNSSNATTGLPSTKQTSVAITGGASQSVNKNMTTTIGTSQASIGFTSNVSTYNYVCRWVSDTLSSSTIAANTWTLTYGFSDGAAATATIHPAIYVWRPSTTTKIGTIFDSDVSMTGASTTEKGYLVTFAGSAVSSIQANDVICCEFTFMSASPVNQTTYYDGTTVITSNAAAAASAASYLETPENITLGVVSVVKNMYINKALFVADK